MGIACQKIRFSALFAVGDVSREISVAESQTLVLAKRPQLSHTQRRRAGRNRCFRRLVGEKKPILYATKMKGFQ